MNNQLFECNFVNSHFATKFLNQLAICNYVVVTSTQALIAVFKCNHSHILRKFCNVLSISNIYYYRKKRIMSHKTCYLGIFVIRFTFVSFVLMNLLNNSRQNNDEHATQDTNMEYSNLINYQEIPQKTSTCHIFSFFSFIVQRPFLFSLARHNHDDISSIVIDVGIRILIGISIGIDTINVQIVVIYVIININY